MTKSLRTTTLPPSSSESKGSRAFDRLHPSVQRWVWQKGWKGLRPVQERACGVVLDGERDVIISAPTAGGKTEAAFLPIASSLANSNQTRLKCLVVSPLKALINDQTSRLEPLFEGADVAFTPWHGDVSASRKKRFLDRPTGVLLITPESLEAIFARRGSLVGRLFGALEYVVIDELHAFLGTERGRQLQSLLHRIELAARRRIPRIALSATLGDMAKAAEVLRPDAPGDVESIEVESDGREIRLQLRGYEQSVPLEIESKLVDEDESHSEREWPDTDASKGPFDPVANDLYQLLRGRNHLVFANSRRRVEELSDRLRRFCEGRKLPNEFFAHHGNLSKEIREDIERRIKDAAQPTTIVCTSTLELGIDIGSVESVAQVGSPPSVSSLLQRIGRSGRSDDAPRILRLFVSEGEIGSTSDLQDELRVQTFQTTAMVQLLLGGYCEPPQERELHLSTLIQQTLSVIAQFGGASVRDLYRALCRSGPFAGVNTRMFEDLIRELGRRRIVTQLSDGDLTLGDRGEQIVDHYSFYAAFATPEEYRLVSGSRTLGSMPVEHSLEIGGFLIFAGRRWKVVGVDEQARVASLIPAGGGKPPTFGGGGFDIFARVRQEMRSLYESQMKPIYLDSTGSRFLDEGRAAFTRMGLDRTRIVKSGSETLLFPWDSDRVHRTLQAMLATLDLKGIVEGILIRVASSDERALREALEAVVSARVPEGAQLLEARKITSQGKYDELLPEHLLLADAASRILDEDGARRVARELLASM